MLAASVVMSHFLFLILFFWCQFCFSLDQFPSGVYQFYYLFKEPSFGSVLIFAFLFYYFLFMPLLFTSSYFYWICLDIPFFFFFGCVPSSLLRAGFSLVAASGGLLFIAARGLLIMVALPVVEHGL